MELTLDQALQKGIEAHKAGRVQEADRYYTAILKANPKHPDANHNMGVLAVGVNKAEAALPFFKAALESNPKIDQFWLSYIDALIKLNRLDEASKVLDQAKSTGAKGGGFDKLEEILGRSGSQNAKVQEPSQDRTNILDNVKLGAALKLASKKTKEGSVDDAKRIYQDILEKFPRNKQALSGIKTLASIEKPPNDQMQVIANLYTQGQYQQALDKSSKLLEQFPNSATLYNIIGAANNSLGKLEGAVEAYAKKPYYQRSRNLSRRT